MADGSNQTLTLQGSIDLSDGTAADAVRVEARDPKTGNVVATAALDEQGRFRMNVDHSAHPVHKARTKIELAKQHHGVGRMFGLHKLEEKLLTAITNDVLPSAGRAALTALEVKNELSSVGDKVADFITKAPFFAASADGRPLHEGLANLELHVIHKDDKGESAQRHGLAITDAHEHVDLGDLGQVTPSHDPNHWAYDPNDDFPRRHWGKQPVDKPSFDLKWTAAYLKILTEERAPHVDRPYGVLVGNFLKKDELKAYWSFAMDAMTNPPVAVKLETNADAQASFPPNKTQALRGANMFLPDSYIVERLLQGMNPVQFRRSASDPTLIEVPFNWDGYERGGDYEINNVTARFTWTDPAQLPVFHNIEVNGETFTPSGKTDGWDAWNWARYQFMVSCFLAGESDAHLTRGHTNMEQYAVPMMMHLSEDNPARVVMAPHLRDVWGINNFGNILIFGETGVLAKCSALSNAGVRKRLKDCLGGEDWWGYAPRAPMNDAHHYAHAANVYWNVTGEHVDAWFEKYWDTASSGDQQRWWAEIEKFSADITHHAVPYVPTWGGGDGWLDTAEFSSPTYPDGTPKTGAVSPLSSLDDLKQLCRYVIFHCTMVHDWTNDRQHDDGGDLMYAALGIRDAQVPADGDWDAWWKRAQPAPSETTYTLFLCYFLSTLKWGMLEGTPEHRALETADKVEHDEYPQIKDLVERISKPREGGSIGDQLAKYGQALEDIRARINT